MTTDTKAEILHEHYRDTCGVMQGLRVSRDRCFYLVIAVLAGALFDVATPQGFATAVGDLLKTRLGLSNTLDLVYVRSDLVPGGRCVDVRAFRRGRRVSSETDALVDEPFRALARLLARQAAREAFNRAMSREFDRSTEEGRE